MVERLRSPAANKTRSCEQKSREARVELDRMPPLAGWSIVVLDKVAVARQQRTKVVTREQTKTLFVLPTAKEEERFFYV